MQLGLLLIMPPSEQRVGCRDDRKNDEAGGENEVRVKPGEGRQAGKWEGVEFHMANEKVVEAPGSPGREPRSLGESG